MISININTIKPIIKAGLQSGTIMCIADIIIQTQIEQSTRSNRRMVGGEEENANTMNGRQQQQQQQHDELQLKNSETKTNNTKKSNDSNYNNDWDYERTIRWCIAGLCIHGPYFFVGFSRIDTYFASLKPPIAPWKMVTSKTLIAQLILFPPYLVALFTYMGYMEGLESIDKIKDKVVDRVPKAFYTGCVYWPIANGTNFALIPNTMRVPYLAMTAGIWNGYLSYMNNNASHTAKK